MIADTTFLSHLHREREEALRRGIFSRGPAHEFLARHRTQQFLVTVITVGEFAVMFDSSQDARQFLSRYRQLRLTPEIALVAAQIDREQIRNGQRLGENDNWIAGFCRYYGQPIISHDSAFDSVQGLRRLVY